MYDNDAYECRFQESMNIAQAEYDNQTPESYQYWNDDYALELSEEEFADLTELDGNETDFEPDWDSENENW